MIEQIVSNQPCSRLILLTYSISEQSLRVLSDLKDTGKIQHLILILDKSIVANKFNLLIFAENIADEIYTIENHAKLVLFDTSFIMTSSNFNKIKRYEIHAHIDDAETVWYLKEEIEEIIKLSERIK